MGCRKITTIQSASHEDGKQTTKVAETSENRIINWCSNKYELIDDNLKLVPSLAAALSQA